MALHVAPISVIYNVQLTNADRYYVFVVGKPCLWARSASSHRRVHAYKSRQVGGSTLLNLRDDPCVLVYHENMPVPSMPLILLELSC